MKRKEKEKKINQQHVYKKCATLYWQHIVIVAGIAAAVVDLVSFWPIFLCLVFYHTQLKFIFFLFKKNDKKIIFSSFFKFYI